MLGSQGRKEMLEWIYGWIQNISVYLIVMAAVMHAIPGKDYGKYIRFFSGLVLILLLFTPLLKLAGMEDTFRTLYRGKEYEMERQEIERAEEIYEQSDMSDFLGADPEEYSETGENIWSDEDRVQGEGMIEVEEIEIGK